MMFEVPATAGLGRKCNYAGAVYHDGFLFCGNGKEISQTVLVCYVSEEYLGPIGNISSGRVVRERQRAHVISALD